MSGALHQPKVSVVVVVHNMAREAPRTLYSLSTAYQQHIVADEYEVIVIDNGSIPPLDPKVIQDLAGNFRLIRLDPAPPSPAHALNRGLAEARGDIIGLMIDGARLVTPGFLHFARSGVRLYPRAVVASLGWYLGLDQQRWAMECNYDQTREDALLASIGWPNDGYRLFEIGAPDESSIDGWFGLIIESNGLFLSRKSWDLLGGVDERFDAPGGGFLNLDTLIRAFALPDSKLVIPLGEATFHQIHGGIATNMNYRNITEAVTRWRAQYEAIRGKPWALPEPPSRSFLGVLPPAALVHFARSISEPVAASPFGSTFDQTLWSLAPSPRPADATVASLVDLAESEFRARHFEAAAAVARMARRHAPDEPAPQKLLATTGAWLRGPGVPADNRRASFHLARAKACRMLGDTTAAVAEFQTALTFDTDLVQAHFGLAELRMSGDNYQKWLVRLHAELVPETYLEIGVARGRTITLAQPPTRAVGVDPKPMLDVPLKTETHIYCETSDEFFERQRMVPLLNGRQLALAFIDGLHVFQQSLKDFINVEALCGPRSVILLHDTVPLDEPTQRPERQRQFYTGDVWKTVLCLKYYRPDLDIITIATPWSGLTLVTGLDPASSILLDNYNEAVARFIDMPYSDLENNKYTMLNIVPNEWSVVESRLKERGIIGRQP